MNKDVISTADRVEILVLVDNGRPAMTADERGVLQTLASQMALAIDGMRLGSEAEEARMEA